MEKEQRQQQQHEAGELEAPLLLPAGHHDHAAAGSSYALVCSLVASAISIIYGYNRGVMSGAQKFVQEDLGVSDARIEVLIGATSIYSLVGSLAAGWACDRLGRRRTMALSAAMFFAGSAVTGAATGYAALMAGQLVAGVACGFGLVVAPVYIAEMAPAASRGFLSSIPEIAGNSGILLSYIADFALAGLPRGLNWRLMIGVGAVPPLFLAVAALLFMPETPRWLVLHGHHDEARRILARTTGDRALADRRFTEIVSSVQVHETPNNNANHNNKNKKASGTSVWREILVRPTPPVRRVLLAVLGLQFFQQASGVAALVLYAPRVFNHVGITSQRAVLGATVLLGLVKTVSIVVPLFLADRLGRRPMLLASAGGMAASLLVLGFSLRASPPSGGAWWAAATSVAAAAAFMATFSLGFGPVIWMYGSEILPLRLRAQGTGIGTAVNRVMSAVVGMTFISLYEAVGMAGSFYIFAGCAAAAWVFVYACLPETKGKSLEEMEALFATAARSPPSTPLPL
ncbi:putative polyol transporter 1 isoform X2 [Brachypodium distachyon]|uniref:putative polyol transporter 1 isoform X2 n=1 Tax=Brachypodium distachyon TaxID=15368 RepID=UPI000D0DD83E|nr:putative polyol transporter 1 isoform X2 [Brachypodium distachyon]|eukprot:XP_024310873.1 putative polyol transporter 1 isoform X2 [Brachypodium distachyon]